MHDVLGQMAAAGLEAPPAPLDLSGTVRRFGPKKRQWYRLREVRTAGGSYAVVGSFGDWAGQSHRVDVDWRGLGDAEREALAEQRLQQQRAAAQARAEAAAQSALTAEQLWARAARQGSSAYLQRKGVEPECCRYLPGGALVIPLLRYDLPRAEALRGLQVIQPDGSKRFTRGLAKTGAALRLGLVAAGEPVLLCEGYATGLSLRMALARRLPVVVALDAGNLKPVAQVVRALHPCSPILICADDDHLTPGNPGRARAHQTARAVEACRYTWPIFATGRRGPKDTDFNDLHLREGLHALERQLGAVLALLQGGRGRRG